MLDHALAELAARQHGVFSLEQAHELGLTDRMVATRVARGRLIGVEPTVYAIAGTPPSWEKQVVQRVLSLRAPRAASHRTAAAILGLLDAPMGRIEVTTARWRRRGRSDCIVHESLDLSPRDVVVVDGIPVTMPARTVVDLAANSPLWMIQQCLDTGLRTGAFTIDDVRQFIERVARRGRRGVGIIRPLLEDRVERNLASESRLEDEFIRLVSRSALPMPEQQYVVTTSAGFFLLRADFAYPAARLLIELDGRRFHSDDAAFQQDRAKQNQAQLEGWTLLRYTWHDVVREPYVVVHQLSSFLRR